MAKSPQSAAESAAPPPDASRCESLRKVAESLGGGEVRLYNLRKHALPDVVNPPPEKHAAEIDWWIVHFPTRKCVAVPAGRGEGLRLLKKLGDGKDEMNLMTAVFGVKKVRAGARAGVRVGARAQGAGETPAGGGESGEESEAAPKKKRIKVTKVPEGLDFDRAMKHVFPSARITRELEKMLVAEDEVVTPAGVVIATKPAWMVRKEGLKLVIEHAQGRAGEKPPPPPDKKKVTYEELEKQIYSSKAARMTLRRLIDAADAAENAPAMDPPTEAKPA